MKLKLRIKKLLFISLAAVLGVSALYNGAFFTFNPKTASAADGRFIRTELTVPNGQFNETSSSSFPKEPSQWTGEALNGSDTTKMYNGIVSMDPDNYDYGGVLESYHWGDIVNLPKNPFSDTSYYQKLPEIDNGYNALMINTKDARGAYAYMSSALTLEANACYEISVWVLTFAFDESGACIRLVDAETGLSIGRKEDSKKGVTENLMAFRGIDTSEYNLNPRPERIAMKNWREYTFNVQTSFTPVNIKISLSVGDDNREPGLHARNTKGIALFDNVTCETISRNDFQDESNNSADFLSYSFEKELKARGEIKLGNTSYIHNSDFTSDEENGLKGWERIDYSNKGTVEYGTANQRNANNGDIPRVADLKEDDNAYTPFTKVKPGFENTALRISHPANEKAVNNGASASGIISPEFALQRFRYYRLSVWFLTLDGAQANIYLSMPTPDETDRKTTPRKTLSSMTALSSAENANTENWQQASFYIKGSSVGDIENVRLELWLGYGDYYATGTHSTGTVYFDKIEIQYLDTVEYNKYSANGTTVALDEFAALSAIANGNFNEVEYKDFDDFKIDADGNSRAVSPLSPSSWTLASGEDKGINPKAVDFGYNDTAVTGGVIAGNDMLSEVPQPGNFNTVLQIKNAELTAAGYSSPDISLSTSSYQKISVSVNTGTDKQTKAFLQLTESGNPIAALENIATNGRWINYSFIVWTSDSASLKLTLWNGWCSEKAYEPDKNLSYGTVYFAAVNSVSSSEADYNAKSDGKDKTVKTVDMNSHFGLFDNSAGALKVPYRYTLSGTGDPDRDCNGGILDTKNFTAKDAEEIFTPREEDGGKVSVLSNPGTSNESLRYILMVNNRVTSAFKYTSVKTVSLSSSSYYRVTISVRTAELSGASGSGAYIGLSGVKNAEISGIESNDKYTAYTFYIATGDESLTFSYELGLGDIKRPSTYTKGFAFFENMSYESISKVEYGNSADTKTARKLSFITSTAETPENDVGKSFWDWYWLPTLLFGAALLFVLIALGVRKLVPSLAVAIAARKRRKAAASYDRGADEPRRKTVSSGEGYTDIIETAGAKRVSGGSEDEKAPAAKDEAKPADAYDDYFED